MGAYLSDVRYIRQFVKELGPDLLRAAAALSGLEPPVRDDFAYCELGAGFGDTVATLAAAHPGARFVGVDLNAEHMAFARDLAARGGLENATFLERDLGDLEGEALPEFDFVGAHGLISWVSPKTQAEVIAFAARRLRPGGLLTVSYNAMPGWAAIMPLRRWLLDAGKLDTRLGDPFDHARTAVEAARALLDRGALYFDQNPAAAQMLGAIERFGPAYVVHEYFQEHWRPQYFADVAAQMAAAGLQFAGQLPLVRNVTRLAVPEAFRARLDAEPDAAAAERLKDYATNAFFRADVYRKGNDARDPEVAARYLGSTRFGTFVAADRLAREVNLPHGPLDLAGQAHLAVGRALADAPASLDELARRPALARLGAGTLLGAMVDLLAGEQIVAMHGRHAPRSAHRYNVALLAEPLEEGRPVVLACPAAGTGLPLPGLQAVMLRALTGVTPGERAAWLRAFVDRQPVKLTVRERRVEDPGEQARILEVEVERYRASRLPKLVALGVLDGEKT